MSRPTEAAPAIIYKDGSDIILNGEVFDPDAVGSSLTKATSSDVNTGTDDVKYVTSFAMAGSSVQVIIKQPFEIAHADILTLPTTGVEILAAQGATTFIFLDSIVIRHKWTADYTNIDSGAQLQIRLGTQDFIAEFKEEVFNGVTGLLAGGGPDGSIGYSFCRRLATVAAAPGSVLFGGTSGYYDSDLLDKAVTIKIDNISGGDLTGGNVANKLQGWINYSVYDFSDFN